MPSPPTMGASAGASSKGSRMSSKRVFRAIMRSYKFKLPKYDFPLRLRPWFILLTTLIMLVLAFLGFTDFAHSLPLNDKILHLVCLCLATTVFYFIFDVEEDARRIWIWRHAPLILTAIICFFFGGIISEVIQSLLPYKEFQMGDVAANLIGSAIGLWSAYYLEKYYRHRREIARLYRPVSLGPDEITSSDEDDDERGTMLLPTHYPRSPVEAVGASKSNKGGRIRLDNVWDEREELFGIGDSDDEEAMSPTLHISSPSPPPPQRAGPKIVVTSS
ncbi:hypothetical protein M0805_006730 [Coniferiporia weirii]|nr:hypothetical protein M0805_006730 [Coniferiporia weirii]